MAEFGLDKPLWQQFFIYVGNLFQGDLGTSFGQYPASVNSLIAAALPWSLVLQIPAILIGWIVGNTLGAIAAFKGGWFDRGAFLGSLFLTSIPYYCLAIVLLYVFAVQLGMFPVGGAYSFGLSPEFSWAFFGDAISYYWLPFWSLVLVFIGGQAVGMRSMAIYELGADYVNYGRGLGLEDRHHHPLRLPQRHVAQITGLALSIGAMIGGALVTELVFSYPGVGTLLFNAIGQNDYPMIQAIALLITLRGARRELRRRHHQRRDRPRIRAAQTGER